MFVKTIKPSRLLEEYIENYIYIEGNNKGISLPKTNMSLVFNLGDAFKLFHDNSFSSAANYYKHWIAGIQTKPNYVESYGKSRMFTIQFKIVGCYAFFKEPLSLFKNEFITLDNVFSYEAEEIWEKMLSAKTLEEQVLIIEDFLFEKLIKKKINYNKIKGIKTLLNENNLSNVNAMTKELNTSRKHLNQLFNNYIGVSTKTLLSIIRINHSYRIISKENQDNLSILAYEMNYADQAHFNNNFKQLTGLTPTEYIHIYRSFPSMKITPHYIPFLK